MVDKQGSTEVFNEIYLMETRFRGVEFEEAYTTY